MKKLIPLLPIAGLLAYLSLSSNSSGVPSVAGASIGAGCNCHGPNSANSALLVTTTGANPIPAAGWTPSTTYTMTVSVTNSARVAGGFDLTVNGGTITATAANTVTHTSGTGLRHSAPKSFVSGGTSWTFSWTAPPASSTLTSVTFSMAGNAVNLSGTDQGDVPNQASGLNGFVFQKAVSVPPAPTVTPAGPVSVCAGQAIPTLTAASSGATSFQWFNGATQITGASTATYTPTAAGSYTAKGVNSAGTSASSNTVNVTVNPTPVLTAVQSDSTLCPGQCDTITLTSTVANTSYAFTIAGGGAGVATGNRIIYCIPMPPNNPTSPQVMTITGIAGNCQGSITRTITPGVGSPGTELEFAL